MSRIAVTLSILSCACVLAISPAVMADPIPRISLADSYGNTNGGEFLATPLDFPFVPASLHSGPAGTFETFCVEVNETFEFGQTYNVVVNTAAVHGGAGGGDPDPLDVRTAYLYQQFITGQLDNYTYAAGDARGQSADALQHVIWYIEQEESQTWTPGDASLADLYFQDATQNAGSSIGDVRVLNLTDESRCEPRQDQLVMIPEPASLALAALGLLIARRTQR